MAFVEDLFKGNIVTGLAVGIGAVVLGPIVAPALTAVVRPAAKAVIKAGIYAYDRGCEALAQANEMTGDIVAEARSEMTGAPVAEARSEVGRHHAHAKPASGG